MDGRDPRFLLASITWASLYLGCPRDRFFDYK